VAAQERRKAKASERAATLDTFGGEDLPG